MKQRHRSFPKLSYSVLRSFSGRVPDAMRGYRVVELLQPGKREKAVHTDSVFNQQLDKVHSVQNQRVQHGLLQGSHLEKM